MRQKAESGCLFLPVAESFCADCWSPPADVYRTRDGWLVKVDLAGIRPEEVEVFASGPTLLVRGVRRDLLIERGYAYHSLEISYSRFERRVTLPLDLGPAPITTEYEAGMLLIHVHTEGRRP